MHCHITEMLCHINSVISITSQIMFLITLIEFNNILQLKLYEHLWNAIYGILFQAKANFIAFYSTYPKNTLLNKLYHKN